MIPRTPLIAERDVASALSRRSAVSLQMSASVQYAARRMAETERGCVLVFDGNEFIGIVAEANIVASIADGVDLESTAVETILTRKPICVPPETSVIHAIYTMKELDLQYLPVVDPHHGPLGIFGLHDAFPSELASADKLSNAKEKLNEDGS